MGKADFAKLPIWSLGRCTRAPGTEEADAEEAGRGALLRRAGHGARPLALGQAELERATAVTRTAAKRLKRKRAAAIQFRFDHVYYCSILYVYCILYSFTIAFIISMYTS